MKSKIISFLIVTIFSSLMVNAQDNGNKKDPVGKWKFETISAPEGYSSGVINVILTEKEYTATMEFGEDEYKLPGEKVIFRNDSLTFSINIEYEQVKISLKVENNIKMTGQAVYSGGTVPLILSKDSVK